jgi:ketosteroid isomerase-like protein
MSIDWQAISVWGDTGVARYHVDFDYAPPNAHGGRIRITSVLRREGGRWLIVHHHEGAVPAGVPPITEAPNRG